MQLPRLTEHFHLGPELGRGGFGVVYRGTTKAGGEPVAIKILLEPPDEVTRGRMAREASALASLRHPRLSNFLGLYRDPEGGVALVYQFIEGRPMEDVLRERLPGRVRGLAWCRDLAEALDALHAAGVVHRDVKPGNLIVGPDDRVTLLDFGLVRDVEAGHTVTQHGLVVGTPQFMAPELLKGYRATPASDVYALGCLVHLLAAGDVPFPGDSPGELVDAHLRKDPPVFPGWAGPARRALAKDPADRPASAAELVRLLETHQPSAATIRVQPVRRARLDPSTPKVAARSSRLPVLRFAVSLGIALGIGAWFLGPTAAPPEPPPEPPATAAPLGPLPPTRPAPSDLLEVLPTEGDEALGLPACSPLPLSGGRAAAGLFDGRVLVADAYTGTIRVGPPLEDDIRREKSPVLLMPAGEDALWALVSESHGQTERTYLFRLEDPLRPPAEPAEIFQRPTSGLDVVFEAAEGLWAASAPGPEAPRGSPGTLWFSRDGARPAPVELPELVFRRRLLACRGTPEGGFVLQISDLSIREESTGTTVLELGPDGERIWSLTFPGTGLDQARLTLAPEGVYLVYQSRLQLLDREGLFGEVPLAALRSLSPPLEGLARHSASQAPGLLHRSAHGVELWTVPPPKRLLYGHPRYHWLRFPALPGATPSGPPERVEFLAGDQMVLSDHTTGVQTILSTGNPDRVLLALNAAKDGGYLALAELVDGKIIWENPLQILQWRDDQEEVTSASLRASPALLPWPGTRGHWLLVPARLPGGQGLVFERYFGPDGVLGERP